MSLALYINPSSCLYEGSCSSSTMIMPRLLKGNNKEDLAPITNLILLFKKGTPFIVKKIARFAIKKACPKGKAQKKPRTLISEATNGEPEYTMVVERACARVREVKGRDIRAVYRARPIETDSTLTAKRTIGTNTETRRG